MKSRKACVYWNSLSRGVFYSISVRLLLFTVRIAGIWQADCGELGPVLHTWHRLTPHVLVTYYVVWWKPETCIPTPVLCQSTSASENMKRLRTEGYQVVAPMRILALAPTTLPILSSNSHSMRTRQRQPLTRVLCRLQRMLPASQFLVTRRAIWR